MSGKDCCFSFQLELYSIEKGLNLWRGVLKKTRKIDATLICYMGEGLGEDNASLRQFPNWLPLQLQNNKSEAVSGICSTANAGLHQNKDRSKLSII